MRSCNTVALRNVAAKTEKLLLEEKRFPAPSQAVTLHFNFGYSAWAGTFELSPKDQRQRVSFLRRKTYKAIETLNEP